MKDNKRQEAQIFIFRNEISKKVLTRSEKIRQSMREKKDTLLQLKMKTKRKHVSMFFMMVFL